MAVSNYTLNNRPTHLIAIEDPLRLSMTSDEIVAMGEKLGLPIVDNPMVLQLRCFNTLLNYVCHRRWGDIQNLEMKIDEITDHTDQTILDRLVVEGNGDTIAAAIDVGFVEHLGSISQAARLASQYGHANIVCMLDDYLKPRTEAHARDHHFDGNIQVTKVLSSGSQRGDSEGTRPHDSALIYQGKFAVDTFHGDVSRTARTRTTLAHSDESLIEDKDGSLNPWSTQSITLIRAIAKGYLPKPHLSEVHAHKYLEIVREFFVGEENSIGHPLFDLACRGDVVGLRTLLRVGGNPRAVYQRQRLVDCAVRHREQQIVQELAFWDLDSAEGEKSIDQAVERGDIACVKRYLDSGSDCNSPNSKGETLLHRAIWNCYVELIRLLLSYGANVNAADSFDRTPFYLAVQLGLSEIFPDLMDRGADPQALTPRARTLFHAVAEGGQIQLFDQLKDWNIDPLQVDKKLTSPFHLACRFGMQSVVEAMDNDVDIHTPDDWGSTPLIHACWGGHLEIAKLLLERGADVNTKVQSGHYPGRTPLHQAVLAEDPALVDLLVTAGADPNVPDTGEGHTPFLLAARLPSMHIFNMLLDNGADPTINRRNGMTVAHEAAFYGQRRVMESIINRGDLPIDQPNDMGATPLHEAARRGNEEIVALLIRNRAEIDYPDVNEWTPLLAAVYGGSLACVNVLLVNGANAHHQIKSGSNGVHFAAQKGHTNIVRRLICAKVDCHAPGDRDTTALQLCVKNGHLNTFELLLGQMSVNIFQKNNAGETLLHLAVSSGNRALIQRLLDIGVPCGQCDENERTALHLAARKGDRRLVEVLLPYYPESPGADLYGNTPLSFARSKEAHDVMDLLTRWEESLEHGQSAGKQEADD